MVAAEPRDWGHPVAASSSETELPGAGDAGLKQPQDRSRLLAFLLDEQSETALRIGLLGTVNDVQIRRGDARAAIRYLEKEEAPSFLVVDLSGLSDPAGTLDDLARVCPPYVTVFACGEQSDIGFYRLLVHQMGITEYIHKPLTRDNVARLFGARVSVGIADPIADRGGRVITVLGASGGVGTTTIAIGLAWQLAEATHGHVALLDLNLQFGATALALGLRPGPGLRIALEDPERADALFLDRVSIVVNERLRLIAAEEPLDAPPQISESGLSRVINLLRQRFNNIVVDMPTPPSEAMFPMIAAARERVVVLGPDLPSLRNTRTILQFISRHAEAKRAITVLNKAGLPGALGQPLIEKGLEQKPDFTIPDLGRPMLRALNLGKPAIESNKQFQRALAPLIQEVSGTQTVSHAASFLGRILRR